MPVYVLIAVAFAYVLLHGSDGPSSPPAPLGPVVASTSLPVARPGPSPWDAALSAPTLWGPTLPTGCVTVDQAQSGVVLAAEAVNYTYTTRYLMLFDRTVGTPAQGVVPLTVSSPIGPGEWGGIVGPPARGLYYHEGLVLCWSATSWSFTATAADSPDPEFPIRLPPSREGRAWSVQLHGGRY